MNPGALGAIFFGANVFAGGSALPASRLASRSGLVKTVVFTHLPSNILLILVSLMPTLPLAISGLLLRFSISQMDVPTRQSYMMAVVHPEERLAAAGITGVARTIGASIAPVFVGLMFARPSLISHWPSRDSCSLFRVLGNGEFSFRQTMSSNQVMSSRPTRKTWLVLPFIFAGVAAGQNSSNRVLSAFVEPEAGRAPLTGLFDSARVSIDLYVFVLTDTAITNSLSAAAKRGVQVRAIVEPCPGGSCTTPVADALTGCNALLGSGASAKWANPAFIKTHAKMALVDGVTALVSTINLENQSFSTRRDYGMTTADPGVIADFQRAFAQDWGQDNPLRNCTQTPASRPPDNRVQQYPTLISSPDNGRERMIGLIASAGSSLKIEMEQIDPQDNRGIVPALVAAIRRGVHLQLLMARPSDQPPNQSVYDAIIAAGGEAQFDKALKLHAKMIVVDRQTLFVGSQNLTSDSLDNRRELGWVLSDPATVFCYQAAFNSDWSGAPSAYPSGLCPNAAQTLAVVSSASFGSSGVSADSIASAFGSGLADGVVQSSPLQLSTTLGGTSLKVRDSEGKERAAPLFFVAPQQLNFQVPPGLATGMASYIATTTSGSTASGFQLIRGVAPDLYSADGSGHGAAAAGYVQVRSDGSQTYGLISTCDAAGKCSPVPIDLGSATDQTYLILYGTGVRGRSSLAGVSVSVGGVNAPVIFAGPQGDVPGFDQINARLPQSLAKRGITDVVLTVEGRAANTLQIAVK